MKKITICALFLVLAVGCFASIAEKLLLVNDFKLEVKAALASASIDMSGVKFSEYPGKLAEIYGNTSGDLNVATESIVTLSQKLNALRQIKTNIFQALASGGIDVENGGIGSIAESIEELISIQITAEFICVDSETGSVLFGMVVTAAGESKETDASGSAKFSMDSGVDYLFTVASTTYVTAYGTATVDADNDVFVVTCYEKQEYTVGDTGPAGGIIAYVNHNNATQGWEYMEACDVAFVRSNCAWSSKTSTEVTGTGLAIGDGASNTALIVAQCAGDSANYTASECYNLVANGYDDWFLPSKDELGILYMNLYEAGIGTFPAASHWSSSESSATQANRRSFNTGLQSVQNKTTFYTYRPCRTFSVSSSDMKVVSLRYNGNNQTGIVSTSTPYLPVNTEVTLASGAEMIHGGDALLGWNTDQYAYGTRYATGTAFTITETTTLYAEWDVETVFVFPDTQTYTIWKEAGYVAMVDWIVASETELNPVFVSHVGDVIQSFATDPEEWEFASAQMQRITDIGVPWATLPGNHDYYSGTRDTTQLDTYFPLATFTAMDTFVDSYDTSSANQAHLVDIRGRQLLIISLEFGVRDIVLDWADSLIKTYSNTPVMIVTHAYLATSGLRLTSDDPHAPSNGYGLGSVALGQVNNGDDIWNAIVASNSNVLFVFSGHVGDADTGSKIKEDVRADGSLCHQVLTNWQYYTYPFTGYMSVLKFTSNTVTMRTYTNYQSINYPAYCENEGSYANWNW